MRFIEGSKTARGRIVARSDEDRDSFLRKNGLSRTDTAKIIQSVIAEEGYPPASLFDFVQGITAHARTKSNQDTQLEIEGKARKQIGRAHVQNTVTNAQIV